MKQDREIRKRRRFIPLRYRFIFMTVSLLVVLVSVLILLVSIQQRHTIRKQLEERGVAIAQSLAATSIADLLTYNYVALERSANQVAEDPGIAAVIFHDKEGRVAGYSGRFDLLNTVLHDPYSHNALTTSSVLIQKRRETENGEVVIEIALPIYPTGIDARWGTVRVQLSLRGMYHQIRLVQLAILAIGFFALIAGIVASVLVAGRITQPLDTLMRGTQAAARGDLDHDFSVNTGDEVEILADNFNTMIHKVHAHRRELELQLEEIKQLQRYTGQLLSSMSDGLMSVTLQGIVSTSNPAVCLLLDTQTAFKENVSVFKAVERFPELLSYVTGTLEKPQHCSPREVSIMRDGNEHTLLVSSSVLSDGSGQPVEIIFTLHDVTILKNLEASMRQNERLAALGTLAAGMAHEIRNPLSSIKTFVQLLPRKHEKPGFLEKFQRTVPRELSRINLLVEDLLDLARVPQYTFRKTSVVSLVQQVVDIGENDLKTAGIEVDCEFDAELPLIQADSHQLAKAIQNLFRNGIEAMPDGGQFHIAISHSQSEDRNQLHGDGEGYLFLVFEDTGEGISAEDLKEVFNPFYTTKATGTGLGLSITHKVITEHGGTITVSTEPGRGTRFVVHLPVNYSSVS